MSITKVFGGAGCGKTYYLTHLISEHIHNGTHPRSICMITLTRNARDEFVNRVKESTDSTSEEMRWFSTMHSVAGKLIGHSTDWITPKDIQQFMDSYHINGNELYAIQNFDQVRKNCLQPATEEGVRMTTTLTGIDTWYNTGCSGGGHISPHDIIRYDDDWSKFMKSNGKYDWSRAISECTQCLHDNTIDVPFKKLFVDEFQDFSPLQYQLYAEMVKHVHDTWICGDDRQCIYRFTGSSPSFLLNTQCDSVVDLPKTYRFGNAIDENAMKYVNAMSTTHKRSITTAPHESSVTLLRGNHWINYVNKDAGSNVYLVRKASHAKVVSAVLNNLGVHNVEIGKSGHAIHNPEKLYNTILMLDSGIDVPGDDIKRLVSAIPAAVDHEQYLQRGVKTHIDMRVAEPYYTADMFCDELMVSHEWDAESLVANVIGVSEFLADNNVEYPDQVDTETKHFVGTIHSFKGNEADNVFLFTQIPFPFTKNLPPRAVDEELRTFYVGATRARYNLYEVSDYLYDGNGSLAMNVASMIR